MREKQERMLARAPLPPTHTAGATPSHTSPGSHTPAGSPSADPSDDRSSPFTPTGAGGGGGGGDDDDDDASIASGSPERDDYGRTAARTLMRHLVQEVWAQGLTERGGPPTLADGRPRPILLPCK